MPGGSFVIVLGYNIGDGIEVRSCLTTEPVERADVFLEEFV